MSEARRVVVIGSGPTGAMAAHTLVQQGIAVTMLESGVALQKGFLLRLMGRNFYRRVPPLQGGTGHIASGDPKTEWFYNLAPGGLSNQWTGAVPRFAPEDFTEGERLHERYRWPITYNDLKPYYEKAEHLLDITADPREIPTLPANQARFHQQIPSDWGAVAEVAAKHGQGLTALPLADGPPFLIRRRGTAFNSFTQIVQGLTKSPHFQLITGAHVLKVEWNAAKRRADAVLYHNRHDGSQQRLEADAIILTCGPLYSTKLLFDSACADFPQGLGNTEGVLGAYLHDHPKEWWVMDTEKPMTLLSPSAYLSRRPYASSLPLLATSWTLGVVTTKDKLLSRLAAKGHSVGVQVFGTMIPTEKQRAKPASVKKDEFGLPILDLCIQYEDDAVQNMVQARQHLLTIMEEAGYRATHREVVPQLAPGNSVHYGGSVRMHQSPKYGMTDAWNRLFAVPNVLVCDASSFTTACEKNPTLTAMAIAARAADRLVNDLKTQ